MRTWNHDFHPVFAHHHLLALLGASQGVESPEMVPEVGARVCSGASHSGRPGSP